MAQIKLTHSAHGEHMMCTRVYILVQTSLYIQIIQQFSEPIGVNFNLTHSGEGTCDESNGGVGTVGASGKLPNSDNTSVALRY